MKTMREFKAEVKKFGGFVENGCAYFHSYHQKCQWMDAHPEYDDRLHHSKKKAAA